MILDAQMRLSSAQALTTQGSTNSTNVYDMGAASDIAVQGVLKVLVSVVAAFTSGGAGTLSISLQGSVDNSTFTTYLSTPAFALADLTAGARLLAVAFPAVPAGVSRPRYWRVRYTVAGADFTGGTVNADIVMAYDNAPSYPAGINPAV